MGDGGSNSQVNFIVDWHRGSRSRRGAGLPGRAEVRDRERARAILEKTVCLAPDALSHRGEIEAAGRRERMVLLFSNSTVQLALRFGAKWRKCSQGNRNTPAGECVCVCVERR